MNEIQKSLVVDLIHIIRFHLTIIRMAVQRLEEEAHVPYSKTVMLRGGIVAMEEYVSDLEKKQ